MGLRYLASGNIHGLYCMLVFSLRGLLEIILSCFTYPFSSKAEIPDVSFVDTKRNREVFEACPSLREFQAVWWARGPHAQTLAQALKPEPKTRYRRDMFTIPTDGVQVALDWKEKPDMSDSCPLILCLHGLGGDRDSRYQQVFTDIASKRGFRAVVYNRRGHGLTSLLPVAMMDESHDGTPKKGPKIFPKHSNLDDMVHVVEHIIRLFPDAPKYMIGFSCGANLAINYLAHVGKSSPFIASASVSNGYNILKGTAMLQEKDSIAYGVVTKFMRSILTQGRLDECKQLAEAAGVEIDFAAVMRTNCAREIERRLVVPAYGYSSLEEYYEDDSCHHKIKDVMSPLLCIATKGDPLVPKEMTLVPLRASKENKHIMSVITELGGHVGWISHEEDPWYLKLYFEYITAVTKYSTSPSQRDTTLASSAPRLSLDSNDHTK